MSYGNGLWHYGNFSWKTCGSVFVSFVGGWGLAIAANLGAVSARKNARCRVSPCKDNGQIVVSRLSSIGVGRRSGEEGAEGEV